VAHVGLTGPATTRTLAIYIVYELPAPMPPRLSTTSCAGVSRHRQSHDDSDRHLHRPQRFRLDPGIHLRLPRSDPGQRRHQFHKGDADRHRRLQGTWLLDLIHLALEDVRPHIAVCHTTPSEARHAVICDRATGASLD